jgi:hypothetical protein
MADISPFKLTAAMSAVSRLKAELADHDDDMILASIESETNALELMDRIIENVVADEALVERGKERLKRIEARADRHRLILKAMMEEIAERVERPLATLSIGTGPRAVIITDERAVPEYYFRHAPDKVAIGKDLKAGKQIEGAELANGAPVLTMRSK